MSQIFYMSKKSINDKELTPQSHPLQTSNSFFQYNILFIILVFLSCTPNLPLSPLRAVFPPLWPQKYKKKKEEEEEEEDGEEEEEEIKIEPKKSVTQI